MRNTIIRVGNAVFFILCMISGIWTPLHPIINGSIMVYPFPFPSFGICSDPNSTGHKIPL